MAERGCLKDGHFQNLEVEGVTIAHTLYFDGKPSLRGLSFTAVAAGTTVEYFAGINANNFVGSSAQMTNLPNATVGTVCVHVQSVDPTSGTETLTFKCATGNAFETGSMIESRGVGQVVFSQSMANDGQLRFTPAQTTTNLMTIGSKIYFTCINLGLWSISYDFAGDPLATTGTFVFLA